MAEILKIKVGHTVNHILATFTFGSNYKISRNLWKISSSDWIFVKFLQKLLAGAALFLKNLSAWLTSDPCDWQKIKIETGKPSQFLSLFSVGKPEK